MAIETASVRAARAVASQHEIGLENALAVLLVLGLDQPEQFEYVASHPEHLMAWHDRSGRCGWVVWWGQDESLTAVADGNGPPLDFADVESPDAAIVLARNLCCMAAERSQ